jgi:hypothetical protein
MIDNGIFWSTVEQECKSVKKWTNTDVEDAMIEDIFCIVSTIFRQVYIIRRTASSFSAVCSPLVLDRFHHIEPVLIHLNCVNQLP